VTPGRLAVPAGTAALVAALGLWHASRWESVDGFVRSIDHGRVLFADFVVRFWPVGRDAFGSGTIYPGYYYSAFFVLLLAPFGALPLESAVRAWGALQVAGAAGLAALPSRLLLGRSVRFLWLHLALFATSVPVLHNFAWGQVSVPLTLGVLACLFLRRSGRAVPAAACLALTVAVKYYTAVFLFWFLVRRDGRFLRAFGAALVLFAALLPAVVLGPARTLDWHRQIAANLVADEGRIVADPNSQYLASVAERWALLAVGSREDPSPDGGATRAVLVAAGWAVAALHLVLVARLARRTGSEGAIPAFAILAGILPFVVPTSWPHYFAHLPFFQAWAATVAFRPGSGARTLAVRGALLAISVSLSSVFAFDAFGDWRDYSYTGMLFVANLFLLVLVDVLALERLAPARPAAYPGVPPSPEPA